MTAVEAFDEMKPAGDRTRALYKKVARWLEETPSDLLASRRAQAEYMFRRIGITFGVYGDKDAAERLIPFDIVPRLISRAEWRKLEAGLTQRVKALNLFLKDVYGERRVLKEGIMPPDLFARHKVAPVDDYPDELLACLRSVAPRHDRGDATIVILTPGLYNSAYYEHSFLADKLGVELVEGRDLFVEDDQVFMRTTLGPRRVDVIYRRVDDDFLDPLVFNPASLLGVPGLVG